MEIIGFKESNIVIAKDQPEYRPIPAHRVEGDEQGCITFCWSLSWRQRLHVLLTGRIWHQVLTFKRPLQPQLLSVEKPEM